MYYCLVAFESIHANYSAAKWAGAIIETPSTVDCIEVEGGRVVRNTSLLDMLEVINTIFKVLNINTTDITIGVVNDDNVFIEIPLP